MSRTVRIRLACAAAAALAALGLSAARPPVGLAGGDDNAAVAINKKDGASIFKFAFSIRRVAGDVVDQTNAAVAYSSCESCQTVAIAIQIVLVLGSPSTVTPQNVAIAINDQCTLCVTVADAYQFVLGGQPLTFTKDGWRQVREIKKAIRDLGKGDLDAAQIQARLDELVAQLKTVLATELVPAKKGEPGLESENETETETTPTTTAPPTSASTTTAPESTTETTTSPATTTETSTTSTTTTTTTTGP